MTLNFPDTPGNGEKYLAENGIEYTYNLANDTWTGALSAQNVPINPSPSDVSVDPPFGNPSGTNPGSGTLADPFIITNSIVPTLNGSTESLQTITITSGKAGDQVVFTNNTTPLDISSKYTQPLGYIDANGKWIGKLVYNDSFGADTTANTTYTGKLQCGTGTVYFQWNVQQQATPAMFVTAGTALTGTPVSGTDLGATQPTVSGGLSPYTYSYKWQTSDNNIAFTDIPSAITSSYSLTSANVGKYIRCIATVSDSSTIQAVTVSSITATVNVVSIAVSLSTQNPQANQSITATAVVLGGVAPVSTAYQWKADGVNIIGATSATYVVEVATNGKRLSCQITTTDGDNTNAVKTSTQTNPVASGDVPEINTVTLAEVTPDSPDRFTDQSFTVAVDMTKDNPKSDYAIRGKVLGDLTVDVETSVITKSEEEAVAGNWVGYVVPANSWRDITYGNGKYVAIADAGTASNQVMYSSDGINWTLATSASVSSWASVTFGADKFVALGATNIAMYSTDGINWTSGSGYVGSGTSVVYGLAADRFVATSGTSGLAYSYDGIAWNNVSDSSQSQWRGITYGNGTFVAITESGQYQAAYSTDGANWTFVDSAPTNNWYNVAYGDGRFVAVSNGDSTGGGASMYSTDNGATWTQVTTVNDTYAWYALAYGDGKFVAGAGNIGVSNNSMWSVDGTTWNGNTSSAQFFNMTYGDGQFVSVTFSSVTNQVNISADGTGVAGKSGVLTLTDTTGLSSINQGDTVVQNSGGTPVTTAITNVADGTTSTARLFTSPDGIEPSNKQAILDNWIELPFGTTTNFSTGDWLAIIPDLNATGPVFSSNGTANFQYNSPVARSGGHYEADGTLLGGDGSYGVSEWVLQNYIDTNVTPVNTTYSIPSNTNGYTLFKISSTPGTNGIPSGSQTTTLTLTDDTNLANFRVGDVVKGEQPTGSAVPGNMAWSSGMDVEPDWNSYNSSTWDINGATVTATGTSNLTASTYCGYWWSDDLVNWARSSSLSFGNIPEVISAAAPKRYLRVSAADGTDATGKQITLDIAPIAVAIVTAIDSATPSITTDGGSWSATNGTGDAAWNQSQIWSSGASPAPVNLFNGNLSNGNAGNLVWTNPTTLTIASSLEFYSYKLSSDTSPNNKMSVVLSGVTEGIADLIPTGSAPTWWSVPNAAGKTLDQILIDPTENPWSPYIRAVRVDGKILVDTGIAGAPQTFVTGPTQAAASGTVKLAGAREVDAAIQTSTITNVNQTVGITTQVPVGTTGDWDGILGVNPDGSTSGPVAIFPDGQGVDNPKGYIHYVNMNIGQTITLFGTATGSSNRAVYGDVQETSVNDFNTNLTVITVTTSATSGSFKIDFNVGANVYGITPGPGATILTLTDDTDLALFTPGDVVQPADGITVYANAPRTDTVPNTKTGIKYRMSITDLPSGSSQYTISQLFGGFPSELTITGNVETWASATLTSGMSTVGSWGLSETKTADEWRAQFISGAYAYAYVSLAAYTTSLANGTDMGEVGLSTIVTATNLSTPSISTDGGAWTGSDGTSSGDVSDRETKVTGPVKTTEVAGPYLTLSSSSGRWLVTETGYSTPLKLNKFAKSSSVQSVASLFTVMDALGNVTDLTTEDPGYTNMVGDPTYTLTFPSVFPSGETPDVELPPGTKYQVEVKATNDIGVDNAFSNEVMPVNPDPVNAVMYGLRFDSDRGTSINRPLNELGGTTWTLSFWIKRTAMNIFEAMMYASGNQMLFEIQTDNTNFHIANNSEPSSDRQRNFAYSFTENKWTHIVMNQDATAVRAWADGISLTATDNTTGAPNSGPIAGVSGPIDVRLNGDYADCYKSEAYYISGQALLPTVFGQDIEGKWAPLNSPVIKAGIDAAKAAAFPNDNTSQVWSAGSTGWVNPTDAFDGESNTYANSNSNSGTDGIFSFSAISGNLKLYVTTDQPDDGTTPRSFTLSDGSVLSTDKGYSGGAGAVIDFGTVSNITSITAESGGMIWMVELDGEILIDGGFGANGFYLPFNPAATGEVWSGTTTGKPYTANNTWANAFDGSLTTQTLGLDGLYTFAFSDGGITIPAGQAVEVYGYLPANGEKMYINGSVSTIVNNQTQQWWDITSEVGSTFVSIGVSESQGGSSSVSAIKINGSMLLNYNNIGVDDSGNNNDFADQNFAVGNTSQVWSEDGTLSGITLASGSTFADIFDGNQSNGAIYRSNTVSAGNYYEVIFNPPISASTVQLFGYADVRPETGGSVMFSINNQTQTYNDGTSSLREFSATVSSLTSVRITQVTPSSADAGQGLTQVIVDGVTLVDANIQDTVTDTPVKNYAVLTDGSNGNLTAVSNGNTFTYLGKAGTTYYYEIDGQAQTLVGPGDPFQVLTQTGKTYNFGQQTFANQYNSSQVWSSSNYTSGGSMSDGWSPVFNGDVTSGSNPVDGTEAIWNIGSSNAITGAVELYLTAGDGTGWLTINGEANSLSAGPENHNKWTVVPGITSLYSIGLTGSGSPARVSGVKVGGNLLVDTGNSLAAAYDNTLSQTWAEWNNVAPSLSQNNPAHVALFNAMNTKFTAFPTARQTFIDALRTKIIGLTLTTPELEVLCGTAKTLVKRHVITIANNKFYIDGVLQATLSLKKGTTYIFDQDEATNSGHTLKLYTDANKTTEYTSGVTVIGTPGGATSRTTFVVPSNAPAVLYYQSTAAASMGGQLNIS
jgi:hypothetical protein